MFQKTAVCLFAAASASSAEAGAAANAFRKADITIRNVSMAIIFIFLPPMSFVLIFGPANSNIYISPEPPSSTLKKYSFIILCPVQFCMRGQILIFTRYFFMKSVGIYDIFASLSPGSFMSSSLFATASSGCASSMWHMNSLFMA